MLCLQVALLSPYVQREVLHHGRGCSEASPIVLPNKVTPEILALLLTYCRFHRASGRSDKVALSVHPVRCACRFTRCALRSCIRIIMHLAMCHACITRQHDHFLLPVVIWHLWRWAAGAQALRRALHPAGHAAAVRADERGGCAGHEAAGGPHLQGARAPHRGQDARAGAAPCS